MSGSTYGNEGLCRQKSSGWKSDYGSDQDNASQYSTESSNKFGNDRLRPLDIGQRVHALFKNQLYTDVKFVVSCGIKPKPFLLAHKAILAIGSPKFAEMFDSKPQQTEDLLTVQINNIPFKAFSCVVEYLYTDDVYFGSQSQVIDIMIAARAFQINALAARCETYIESSEVTAANVCTKLQLATLNKLESLKLRCTQFIQENTVEVLRSSDFKNSNSSTVRAICKMSQLNLSSEMELFEGVMRWIECQSESRTSKRELLQPFLRHIRFLTIPCEVFSQLFSKYPDIFTDTEALNIVLYLSTPSPNKASSNLPDWCNRGDNRCLNKGGAQWNSKNCIRNISDQSLSISLRPTARGFTSNLMCMLEMKCTVGHHRIKALKLAFDEPITKESSIDQLIITVTTVPSKFIFKEHIKISNSAEVVVPFTRRLLARKGDTVYIRAEATEIRNYKFFQFDDENSFLSQVSFHCSVGSVPKENRLFFIAAVIFEDAPHYPVNRHAFRGRRS